MSGVSVDDQIEIFRRGATEVIQVDELRERLKKKTKLRVKAGFDPTAPDLHLGHTVLIQKLKQIQELGHDVLFLIGDFTARIGDPTGKHETRKMLTDDQVRDNTQTYREQIFKILDHKSTQIVFNSSWLNTLKISELVQLASHYTVARMLERDDFHARYKAQQPISIHEFLYPLFQGYDSVALHADIEIGGNDQKFNLLVGREMQRHYNQQPQIVLTYPLLVGTDGTQKMSKSLGNHIGINEPAKDIYGKVLRLSDSLMWTYYELLSDHSTAEIAELKKGVEQSHLHPKDVKMRLAWELTARFHGKDPADKAQEEFQRVFSDGGLPDKIDEAMLSGNETDAKSQQRGLRLISALKQAQMTDSTSEARRMIRQGAVELDGQTVQQEDMFLSNGKTFLLRVGKRRFRKIKLVEPIA